MSVGLRGVVAVAVPVRVAHALLIRTSFSPDEYWQCLEVAHRLVFGCAVEHHQHPCRETLAASLGLWCMQGL